MSASTQDPLTVLLLVRETKQDNREILPQPKNYWDFGGDFPPKAKGFLFSMFINFSLMMDYFVLWFIITQDEQANYFSTSTFSPSTLWTHLSQTFLNHLSLSSPVCCLSPLQQHQTCLSFPFLAATQGQVCLANWNAHILMHSHILWARSIGKSQQHPIYVNKAYAKPSHCPICRWNHCRGRSLWCPAPLPRQCTRLPSNCQCLCLRCLFLARVCSAASMKAESSREQPPHK